MRVLVVDDDTELLELVRRALVRDEHEVSTCTTGEEALLRLRSGQPEIAVIDLGLPGMSGEELCRRIRAEGAPLAILVLTAQSAVSCRVRCLDEGADDYLSKPFALAELRARIRALGRRVPRASRQRNLVVGEVELDFGARQAKVAGRDAPITAREWAILEVLAAQSGQVVSRRELIARVWSQPEDEGISASLEVLVGRIRRKLTTNMLRTVRGEGYVLDEGKPEP